MESNNKNNTLVITTLESLKDYCNVSKEVLINSLQKLEKKIFPKNEQMDISTEVKKRTNTLVIAITLNTPSTSDTVKATTTTENNYTQEKNKLKNKRKSKGNLKNNNSSGLVNFNKKSTTEINSNKYFVVGYLIYSKKDSIIKFAVDPSKRNLGTGWKLLSYSMERMTNQMPKGHKINLAVDISRLPAQHLYSKVGFKIKEQIDNYYEPGRHAYIMEYFV
ncbi:hypothetical protein BCR36DRAFT_585925 [Piromyces finnis]|uniref:N-acetyltransferase domain-containing protein n=1 Tax=Piromyces finnis TaxID=1754191 RepID=A0A1Y1V2E5_9FUNG|nr:hypothetical protein BCR36DRAFT_585925 [Piromyces finnis]|eukprot:ORX45059.1 hypothetical protein BCR36DRAFT_585925 [Piromyces finnis]